MTRRPSAKDAQEVIHFEEIDFEHVAEKRQAASQTKNHTNLAQQSGVSKTHHNVKLLLWKSNRHLRIILGRTMQRP